MTTVDNMNSLFLGVITNVDDPLNRGRVMANIPAIGEVGWCRKRGGVADKEYGITTPSIEGAEILIQFEGGNIDNPWWEYADCDIPTDGKLRMRWGDCVLEGEMKNSGRGVWKLYMNSLSSNNYIELNGETNQITIKALTKIEVQTIGEVSVVGAIVKLQGRTVVPGAHPIK